jgi:hypothetical protein
VGIIPFTGENIKYLDKETQVEYTFRQATDEVEIKLLDFIDTFKDENFEGKTITHKVFRDMINGQIDIILVGWSSKKHKLPKFQENPSSKMKGSLKLDIIEWWKKQSTFGADDIKK